MRRWYEETFLGILMLLLISLLWSRGTESLAVSQNMRKTSVVVLDAGHGGEDPGKIGVNNALEKDININIVLMMKDILEAKGIEVVLTRTGDAGLYKDTDGNKKIADMNARCRIIDESQCSLVVSVHQNSYSSEDVRGPQVFYFKNSKEGIKAAGILHQACQVFAPESNRVPKANDNYYLLLHTAAPVVICECGFLSNWQEAELLVTHEYQKQIAEALCGGIMEYLSTAENREDSDTKKATLSGDS